MAVTREDLIALDQITDVYAKASAKAAEVAERYRFGRAGNEVSIETFAMTQKELVHAWSAYRAASVDLMIKAAAEGKESPESATRTERPTISTLEEIQLLPKGAVILEDQYQAAYQKMGDNVWSGEYTRISDPQIDLPCTLIYDPSQR